MKVKIICIRCKLHKTQRAFPEGHFIYCTKCLKELVKEYTYSLGECKKLLKII